LTALGSLTLGVRTPKEIINYELTSCDQYEKSKLKLFAASLVPGGAFGFVITVTKQTSH
jgi:hypothetical protein